MTRTGSPVARLCQRARVAAALLLALAAPAVASSLGAVVVGALAVTGCSPSVAKVNSKPDLYYGETMKVSGRVGDYLLREDDAEATVFQLVAAHGDRIIVVAPPSARFSEGRKVRVQGTFVAKRAVGGHTFYDVLVATSVSREGFMRRMLRM